MNDLISRQAAIDYCYALINAENPSDPSDEWNYSQERINQTEVILHHLEFMPSAQPESEERKAESAQNVPIEDLISRKAAIDALDCINGTEEVLRSLPSAQPEPCKDAVSREAAIDVAENAFVRGLLASIDIRKLPSVQPDIVRCKDCMHYSTYYRGNESKPVITHLCKWCLDRTMEPDDYCSRAERRTDEADYRKE